MKSARNTGGRAGASGLVRSVTLLGALTGALTCALWSGLLLAPSPAFAAQPAASSASQPAPGQPAKSISVTEAIDKLPANLRVPNRYALVIGVDQYASKAISPLNACVKDATELARVLSDPAAGMMPLNNVTVLTNAQVTRAKVVTELERLARITGDDDLVIVFFSGHGMMDAQSRGYWIMHDTEPEQLRATGLSRVEIDELLGSIKTRRLVAIVDACHAAATAEVGKTKAGLNLDSILPKFDGDGRVLLLSSDSNQLSVTIPSGEGAGHSAFAWHVIEGLRGKAADDEGVVTVDNLWNYVKSRTEETARRVAGGNQRPRLEGNVGGKFLLAINGDKIRERAAMDVAAGDRAKARIETLRRLALDGAISLELATEGQRLLGKSGESLDPVRAARRKVYVDLTEGRLAPEYLDAALGKFPLEAVEERDARLAREAAQRAEADRKSKAEAAILRAKQLIAVSDWTNAANALGEAQALNPKHVELGALRERVDAALAAAAVAEAPKYVWNPDEKPGPDGKVPGFMYTLMQNVAVGQTVSYDVVVEVAGSLSADLVDIFGKDGAAEFERSMRGSAGQRVGKMTLLGRPNDAVRIRMDNGDQSWECDAPARCAPGTDGFGCTMQGFATPQGKLKHLRFETVNVRDRAFHCQVVEMTFSYMGTQEARKRQWLSSESPGGLVKSEFELTAFGLTMRMTEAVRLP